MKVKVSELEGRALNYAVAVCEYGDAEVKGDYGTYIWLDQDRSQILIECSGCFKSIQPFEFNPQGNWAHAGAMIRKYRITLSNEPSGDGYMASINAVFEDHPDIDVTMHGSTQLEAICLCLVKYRNRLNDEIEIPDELVEE